MAAAAWIFVAALALSAAGVPPADGDAAWERWVPVSEFSLFPTLPIAAPLSEDDRCREDSRRLVENLRNKTLWAMQMWDSSATGTFGVLHGNKYHFGNYDECLAVTRPLKAQYCEAKIRATVHLREAFRGDPYDIDPEPNATVWKKFQDSRRDATKYPRDESQWGLCVPSSCNATEMEKAINLYLGRLNEASLRTNGTTYAVEIPEKYCFDGTEDPVTYGEMGFWLFTWLILVLVGVATSVDLAKKKDDVVEESPARRYLMKFSLKRNVPSLMDRDEGGRKAETSIIYGLRFYNVCYIVTDHRMGVLLSTVAFNSQRFEEDFRSWLNVVLPHGDLLVDTYFFIGGYVAALNLLDLYKRRFHNPFKIVVHRYFRATKLLMAFSLKRNLRRIVESEDAPETDHLRFLHGVRCVSIGLIVLDHHVAIFLPSAMYNRQNLEQALRSHQKLFLPHGDLLVDTFFFISGFLVAYLFLAALLRQRVNMFAAVVHRFFRLAPLYFYVVWFQASAFSRFGSGPAWKLGLADEIEFCRKNWWANVLFVQNYVNPREMCMLHAWYLPCDLHFFILAVCLIVLITKDKKIGSTVLHAVTFVSIFVPGIVTYVNEIQPLISFNPKFVDKPRLDPSFEHLYVKSHTRATVYLLGVLTAYHLFRKRKSTWKISRVASVLTCFLGLGLLFAPMVYGSLYYDPRKKYNLAESTVFAVLRRLSWGLAWVLFMIVNRFGVIPIFGKVFRWKISVPLSKTTYAIYLIHFLIQMADEAKAKIPYQFISFDMFVKGTNDLFFATGYALVLYLVIELPLRLILKELLFPAPMKKVAGPPELPPPVAEASPGKGSPPQVFSIKL